tara:strand:+ start:358 stop:711 length:354 start_codon:yes stop_codon:yes gene_type:complete
MNPFLQSIFVTIPETTFPSKFGNEAFDSRIRFSRKVSFSFFFPNLVGVVLVVAEDGFDEDDDDAGEDEESKRVKKMSFLLCPPPLRRSLWMSLEEEEDKEEDIMLCQYCDVVFVVKN